MNEKIAIRKSLLITKVHEEMLAYIMRTYGFMSEGDIFRQALIEYYDNRKPKEKPAYVKLLESRPKREPKSPQDRAEDEVLKHEAVDKFSKEREYEHGMKIIEALYGAKVKKEHDGSYWCTFPTYSMSIPPHVEIGEMKLPFSQLTEDTIETQFEGNKEAIINIIESKHVEKNQPGKATA